MICTDNTRPKSELPQPEPECAGEEFAKFGRPAMSPVQGEVTFGVSSPLGKPTTVYIWMDNRTDQTKSYYMCCRSSFLDAIDVYDSAGQRLLSKAEQAERKMCAAGDAFIQSCSCSFMAAVAPHTLQVVDSGDLGDGYVLSAGRYFIVPARVNRGDCESLRRNLAETAKVEPTNAIMVVIPEQ